MDGKPHGFLEWLSRLGAWRGDRRRAGLLGASLLVSATAPEPAGARRKRRRAKREQAARDRAGTTSPRFCGGIAGFPCPEGLTCVDDPLDDCDPEQGGADCGGICVRIDKNPCARMRCRKGTVCCDACGGLCIPRGTPCSDDLCPGDACAGMLCGPGHEPCNRGCCHCVPVGQPCTAEGCPPDPPKGEPCGSAVCGEGEYCCAAHCSLCKPLGERCLDVLCPPPAGEACGRVQCDPGQYCCNPSCGICTPPGGACIMIACEDETTR